MKSLITNEGFKTVFFTSGAKIIAAFLSVINLSITARYLGPSGRGEFVTATTWALTFSTIACLSLGNVLINKKINRNESEWIVEAIGVLKLFLLVSTVLIISSLLFLRAFFSSDLIILNNNKMFLFILLYIPLGIWDFYLEPLFSSLNKLSIINKVRITTSTLNTLLILLFYLLDSLSVEYLLAFYLLSMFAQYIVTTSYFFSFKRIKFTIPKKEVFKQYIYGGVSLHLGTISTFVFTSSDILMISYYLDESETGFYQLASAMINMILIIPQSIRVYVLGQISNTTPNHYWIKHKEILHISLLLSVVAIALIHLFAESAVTILAGKEFLESVYLLKVLSYALFGATLGVVISPQWIGRGYFKTLSFIALVSGLTNFFLNTILIPRLGAKGAVFGSLASWSIVILTSLYLYMKCNKLVKAPH